MAATPYIICFRIYCNYCINFYSDLNGDQSNCGHIERTGDLCRRQPGERSYRVNKPDGDTFQLIYNIGSHPNNVAYLDGSYYFAKADAIWEMEVISTADNSSESGGGGGGGGGG